MKEVIVQHSVAYINSVVSIPDELTTNLVDHNASTNKLDIRGRVDMMYRRLRILVSTNFKGYLII